MWSAMEPMRLRPARGCAPACGAARTRRREGRWVGHLSGAALLCLVGRRGASRQPRRAGFATVEKVKPKRKSYGPKAGFAAEKPLRSWLRGMGAKGLELLQLGKRSGVWLKPSLTEAELEALARGKKVIEVPQEAWITVQEGENTEEALAAELLKEKQKGFGSKFQPYVDFLWRRELAHHPMFWSAEEIAWLSGCQEVQKAVLSLQELTRGRVERLSKRFEMPEEELRFALCLVESRAITTSAVPGALVPLLDHLRNDSTGSPAVLVGDEGLESGAMVAVALEDLEPEMELRNCFDSVSNQELFCQYGEVQIRVDADEVVPEVNAYNEVPLPIQLLPEHWKGTSASCRRAKEELLRSRGGIDLSGDAFLRLPMDAMANGRLLPLARFIRTPAAEDQLEELFERLFKDCHRSLLGGKGEWEPVHVEVPPAPKDAQELFLEVQARQLMAHWYENTIVRYNRMSKRVQQEMEDSYRKASSSSKPSETLYDLAEVCSAYYKAKQKDGSSGKSRKSKECRVLSSSPSDNTVTVQFLENGICHIIPEDWVVKKGSAEQELSAKRSRGRLALALLTCQGSIIQACFQLMLEVLQLGQGILESRKEKERAAIARELEAAWKKEYDLQSHCDPGEA